MAAFKNIPLKSRYGYYLEHYYHLKSLERIGFRYRLEDFDPFLLSAFSHIELTMTRLENEETQRKMRS